MKSLNSLRIAPRTSIEALSLGVLLALTPSASAHETFVDTHGSPWSLLHSHSPASRSSSLSDALSVLAPDLSMPVAPLDLDLGASGEQLSISTTTVISSSGAIEADLDLFRALLGGANNGATPGQQPAGRREINWDGVPAGFTNAPNFPNNFFNSNSPRGLVYESTSRGLQVSNQSFVDVNREFAGEFLPFSGQKTFSPIGSNTSDIVFFVAGSQTKAAVRGIGIVFMDVDRVGSTAIELVGEDGLRLGRFAAPLRSDRRGASFVGVVFRDPVITKVHIVSGSARLAADEFDVSNGGQHDLVVMDDFIYGEPTAIRD